jgi:hypothetical protein
MPDWLDGGNPPKAASRCACRRTPRRKRALPTLTNSAVPFHNESNVPMST